MLYNYSDFFAKGHISSAHATTCNNISPMRTPHPFARHRGASTAKMSVSTHRKTAGHNAHP